MQLFVRSSPLPRQPGRPGDPSAADRKALSYAWDLNGDGVFETPGRSVTFDASGIDGPAVRTASVRVTDPNGASASATAGIEIRNVAPAAVTIRTQPPAKTGADYLSASELKALFSGAEMATTVEDGTPVHVWMNADGSLVAQTNERNNLARDGRWLVVRPDKTCLEFEESNGGGWRVTPRAEYAIGCFRVRKIDGVYKRYDLDGKEFAGKWELTPGEPTRESSNLRSPIPDGPLTAKQIKAVFTAATLDGVSSDGSADEIHEFLADGRLEANYNPAPSTFYVMEGSWRVQQDNRLCIDWPTRVNVVQGCYGVVKSGGGLELVDDAGSAVWWYDLPDRSFARLPPPRTEAPKISKNR